MRSRWNLSIYVAYLAVSLVVIGFIVAEMGITPPWSHPYSVTATFADAADILNNNEVFMNGTKVGHVGDVTVVHGHARVQLVIDDPAGLPIHRDATAEVRKKNLLGETYIDLQRGHAAADLASGGQIPLAHTIPITEIDQVLAIFDPQTVQRVQLLIDALGDATTNNGANLNAEATASKDLVSALDGPAVELSVRKQQMQDIVLELQRFYGVLANQRDQVRQEFGTWNQVMSQLAAQEAAIGGTITQADTLVQNVDTLVAGRGAAINGVLRQVATGANGTPSVLASLNSFLDQSNAIIAGIAPDRRYVGDVFPDLQTSFADTVNPSDPNSQHFWTVFSVGCAPPQQACSGPAPASYGRSPSSYWTALAAGGLQ
jgi:phospholipid/cholesterol/gamma-HCH transport system substrate-binding protein